MGTHPIFESDFDCLTEKSKTDRKSRKNGINEINFMRRFGCGKIKTCLDRRE